ncbi:MAG: copper chaperone PCu(A)C [Gammaproteobacteria bacterium]|nr:copper chaperone PCu(A)C [Gammaproteobacteria bacterium]MCP5196678.1 copper chaperone PCu(A)C [Gammaproteobacteria bacterium]
MNRLRFSYILTGWVLLSTPFQVNSHGYVLGNIKITHPWTTPTGSSIAGRANNPGYLTLKNRGHQPDKLLSVSADIATKIEFYASIGAGSTSKPRRVDALEVPAGKTVRLKPGASHLMLVDLQKPLDRGSHFPLVLKFEHSGTITVDMFVQSNAKESIY